MKTLLWIVLVIAVIAAIAWFVVRSRRDSTGAVPDEDHPGAVESGTAEMSAVTPTPADITTPTAVSSPVPAEPEPEEQPVAVAEPETEEQPVVAAEPEPEPIPEPESEPETEPEPVEEPLSEPDTEPVPPVEPEPESEPIPQPEPEPVAEADEPPVKTSDADEADEPVEPQAVETVPAPEPEPVEEPLPEPDPITEPVPPVEPEPIIEPEPPIEPEPIIEPEQQDEAEPADSEPSHARTIGEQESEPVNETHGDPLAAEADQPVQPDQRKVVAERQGEEGELPAEELDPHAGWETEDDKTVHADPESGLYHTPDSPGYKLGEDGVVFESEDDARAAGFTRWDQPS